MMRKRSDLDQREGDLDDSWKVDLDDSDRRTHGGGNDAMTSHDSERTHDSIFNKQTY